MSAEHPLPQLGLDRFAAPRRIWVAPHAARALEGERLEAMRSASDELEILSEGATSPPDGPAVPMLAPADLDEPVRSMLPAVLEAARPGRPVLLGGERDKDVLLDAINRWHVVRVVPADASSDLVRSAAERAFEAMNAAVGVERGAEELRRKTRALADTHARLERTQEQIVHNQRLSTLGRIAEGLIQDVREHVRDVEQFHEVVHPRASDEELRGMLEQAREGTRSMLVLLDEIRAYAEQREQDDELRDESLDALAEHAARFARLDRLSRDRHFRTELGASARVHVDRHRLYHVLLNLMRNAFQATEPGDEVVLRTRRDDDAAVVEVEDTGPGIPPGDLERIFDAFFSRKPEAGIGLGLKMCQRTIERHGGSIQCYSDEAVGTRFRIALPTAGGEAAPSGSTPAP